MASDKPYASEPVEQKEINAADSGKETQIPISHQEALHWSLWRILINETEFNGATKADVINAGLFRGMDREHIWGTVNLWGNCGYLTYKSGRIVLTQEMYLGK